ncbi:hypothetical protein Msi02_75640 [Microbispora siamensis]|uniref:Uncharacterized protein n=1 Tax=Microbispora siamensis TaxID=564413 RepID=A0ABQ4GZ67_9ACTN|nr:hypothetical protein Msi02_75640 [Microbispora siamensis]
MCILQQNLTDQDDRFGQLPTAGNPLSGEEKITGIPALTCAFPERKAGDAAMTSYRCTVRD